MATGSLADGKTVFDRLAAYLAQEQEKGAEGTFVPTPCTFMGVLVHQFSLPDGRPVYAKIHEEVPTTFVVMFDGLHPVWVPADANLTPTDSELMTATLDALEEDADAEVTA